MTDPATDYATDAEAEQDLFGAEDRGDSEPPAAAAPAPKRRAPGPPPNPLSKRQQKLAKSATRSRTTAAPVKRAVPNAKAKADPTEVYQRGAMAVIGWVARPLAAAGMGLAVASNMPRVPDAKRAVMAQHAMALNLDSLTLSIHAEGLAEGMAAAADHVPWMGQVLEKAAKISPFASLLEVGTAIVFQVLANHGVMPFSPALGTLTPEELAAAAGVPLEPEPVG